MTSAAIASPLTGELARAVHRGVEVGLALHARALAARALGVEHAGVNVGVDRHLLPRHSVERKARRHLGDALRAAGILRKRAQTSGSPSAWYGLRILRWIGYRMPAPVWSIAAWAIGY
jgi:hypothetical protein